MDQPLGSLLFEYPGADIILRSQDSHEFRIPKSYVINNSPILEKLIRKALAPPMTRMIQHRFPWFNFRKAVRSFTTFSPSFSP